MKLFASLADVSDVVYGFAESSRSNDSALGYGTCSQLRRLRTAISGSLDRLVLTAADTVFSLNSFEDWKRNSLAELEE